MKLNTLTALAIVCLLSCQKQPEKVLIKYWLDTPVDLSQIQEIVNTYYMFDSTNAKVGSMVFGFSFEEGMLMARDTSQFDNGSIYETAELAFDTSIFQMRKVLIDLKTPGASLDIDLRRENNNVVGSYIIKRDTTTTTYEIDSVYQFSAFREEIYILTHALSLKQNDTLDIQALVPTSMSTSQGQLIYSGEEEIETSNGMEACEVVWLKTDGKMPDNKIWITKDSPRTIVKFYIPGPELDIVLVDQK